MPITGAVIVPHPPLIIPTVGQGKEREVQATIDAYRTAARQVTEWNPEVLIVTSPHTAMYADYFHISPGKGATGDMSAFGAPQTRFAAQYDGELRDEVIRQAEAANVRAGTLGEKDPSLNHGTFLPLYFLQEAGINCPILRIGLSGFSPLEHYRLGQCVAKAVDKLSFLITAWYIFPYAALKIQLHRSPLRSVRPARRQRATGWLTPRFREWEGYRIAPTRRMSPQGYTTRNRGFHA